MNRQCGDCQLCCKLVPVVELDKKAGQRCQHQRHGKGCVIYGRHPLTCKVWSCRWLNGHAGNVRRPDRSHYVIDVMPDYITIENTGEPNRDMPVIQVWVDPDYLDAHHDPELRAYLAEQAMNTGCAAIIRWDSRRAVVLFPPALSADGQWHEVSSNMQMRSREEHVAGLFKVMESTP